MRSLQSYSAYWSRPTNSPRDDDRHPAARDLRVADLRRVERYGPRAIRWPSSSVIRARRPAIAAILASRSASDSQASLCDAAVRSGRRLTRRFPGAGEPSHELNVRAAEGDGGAGRSVVGLGDGTRPASDAGRLMLGTRGLVEATQDAGRCPCAERMPDQGRPPLGEAPSGRECGGTDGRGSLHVFPTCRAGNGALPKALVSMLRRSQRRLKGIRRPRGVNFDQACRFPAKSQRSWGPLPGWPTRLALG